MDNKQIIEALRVQPLSEEDKNSRHILGRLYGPIATTLEGTRNGRKYNRRLWEKALNDDIFKEKVGTKSLFLELGHPADREETDMTKICAVIPEMPKIIDGDLYAYVDILDTANGKILKTLIDYGFVPGISSRGSGDIMPNDEVDPETFFLETWDIVQLPAVKKARLNVCESLDAKKTSLRHALTESFNKASDEDKEIMKETLDNLDIKLEDETIAEDTGLPDGMTLDDIPDGQDPQSLLEEVDDAEIEVAETEPVAEDNVEIEEEPVADEEAVDEDAPELDVETATIVTNALFELLDTIMTDDNKEIIQNAIAQLVETNETITEDQWKSMGCIIDDEEGSEPEMVGDTEILPAEANSVVGVEIADAEGQAPEVIVINSEAVDNGDVEMMESLKDLIRQKSLLENEVKALKKAQTVGNAEVESLKEELDKYKTGFVRVSELAGQATKAKKEVATLTEQINQKDAQINQKNAQIKDLQSKVEAKTKLTESVNEATTKVKTLTTKLNKVTAEAAKTEKTLNEQMTQCNKKLALTEEKAKQYKNKFTVVLNHYIESKAKMLGVKPSDITSKLNESYTLSDIDNICDEMLNSTVNLGRLPFNTKKAKAIIKESVQSKSVYNDPDYGYEIDDSLLELAGLKK